MDRPVAKPLRIGDWRVDPTSGQMAREGEVVRLEARTMRLLLCLAERADEVVSVEELLNRVWSGVVVTPDSVYQAVASLRRLLGDDARQPAYIATVPRLGYRMVATVSPWVDPPSARMPATPASTGATPNNVATPGVRRWAGILISAGGALVLALSVAVFLGGRAVNEHAAGPKATAPARSVAVLPFLDLTSEKMSEEYFADGMTEELTDKLSKISGLRVPAPASSLYFKGKHVPVADIAKSLGVVYVLSGSVRQSDTTLRIAVRLIRADDGYVIWSETYDRPAADKLLVQEQIADEVTKSLSASINSGPPFSDR